MGSIGDWWIFGMVICLAMLATAWVLIATHEVGWWQGWWEKDE